MKKPEGLRLLSCPAQQPTPQRQIASEFTARLNDIKNFVVLAQAKDGSLQIMPCIDSGVSVLDFVSVFQARLVDHTLEQLTDRTSKPQLRMDEVMAEPQVQVPACATGEEIRRIVI